MLDEGFGVGDYAARSAPKGTSIDNNAPRFHPLDSTTLPWRTLPMVIYSFRVVEIEGSRYEADQR